MLSLLVCFENYEQITKTNDEDKRKHPEAVAYNLGYDAAQDEILKRYCKKTEVNRDYIRKTRVKEALNEFKKGIWGHDVRDELEILMKDLGISDVPQKNMPQDSDCKYCKDGCFRCDASKLRDKNIGNG